MSAQDESNDFFASSGDNATEAAPVLYERVLERLNYAMRDAGHLVDAIGMVGDLDAELRPQMLQALNHVEECAKALQLTTVTVASREVVRLHRERQKSAQQNGGD